MSDPKPKAITINFIADKNAAKDIDVMQKSAASLASADGERFIKSVKSLEDMLNGNSHMAFKTDIDVNVRGLSEWVKNSILKDYIGKEEATIRLHLEGKDVNIPVTRANITKVSKAFEAATQAVVGMASKLEGGTPFTESEIYSGIAKVLKANLLSKATNDIPPR